MVRYYKHLFLLISSIFLLCSCQEGREAGDLWGQWKMVSDNSKHVAFSGATTVFREIEGNKLIHQIYGSFQHQGDSLFIQCHSIEGDPLDTLTIENDYGFKPFTNIRLKIDKLDDDNLVLSKDSQRWSFYKY